jgi:hypothetical protein
MIVPKAFFQVFDLDNNFFILLVTLIISYKSKYISNKNSDKINNKESMEV